LHDFLGRQDVEVAVTVEIQHLGAVELSALRAADVVLNDVGVRRGTSREPHDAGLPAA
jgi:hypothetical protein